MESSPPSSFVGPEATSSESLPSVHGTLYSLARTPIPARFHRRCQRLLLRKPRLSRVRRVAQDGCRITSFGDGSLHHAQTPIQHLVGIEPSSSPNDCQRHSSSPKSDLTLEQTIRLAQLALHNPAADTNNRREANRETDEKDNDPNRSSKQLCFKSAESLPSYIGQGYHDDADDDSMFIKAHGIAENEESDNIERAILYQSGDDDASLEAPLHFSLRGPHGQSSGSEQVVTHQGNGRLEIPTLDKVEHVFIEPEQNLLPSPMKKLQRPARKKQIEKKTYGYRRPREHQKHPTKPRMPRRLPVEELETVADRVPSNPTYNSDAETTELDDDPIQDFSSSPSSGSRPATRRYNAEELAKKRKPLNDIQQNILKAAPVDLSKYKLPKAYEMSPNTKKRLKTSITCSDGFEGRERMPTGKTMPMRLPRRHPQTLRPFFACVSGLTFVSSRDFTEDIASSQRLQGESLESNAIAMLYNGGVGIMTDTFDPLTQQVQGSLRDNNRVHRLNGNLQLDRLTGLLPTHSGDGFNTEKIAVVMNAPTICRPKRRVTFSKDVEILQTLRMVSAPIAITSPCNSNDSEEGSIDDDDDDDDRTSSRSSEGHESEMYSEQDSDDHTGSDDGNSSTEIDADGEEAFQRHTASVKIGLNGLGPIEDPLKQSKPDEARNKSLAWNNQSVCRESVNNGDMDENNCQPGFSFTQSVTVREKILATGENRQRQKIVTENPWIPRRPVSTYCLIEVDDDILDDSSSPSELSKSDGEHIASLSASAHKRRLRSYDDHHAARSGARNRSRKDLQERKLSQASVELGDPNWSVPYGHVEEYPDSQVEKPEETPIKPHGYTVEDHPTHMARALDSFKKPLQGSSNLVRSKSMPSNYQFNTLVEPFQEDLSAEKLIISPAFKHTVSLRKRSLSRLKERTCQSKDLKALTRRMSIEAGTTSTRGRIQPLPFIPPFLKD